MPKNRQMPDDTSKGMISRDELEQAIKANTIDTVIIAFVDMQGRLMGKRLTGHYFLAHGSTGTHFCKYLLGTDMEMNTPPGYALMNWENGYGDWLAKPDWSTLRVIPWLEKTALVLADVVDEAEDDLVSIAPRTVLRQQLKKAADRGFLIRMASELEFYLIKDPYDVVHENGYVTIEPAGHYNEDYNLLQATRNEPIYHQIRTRMAEAGIPVESSKGEAWAGQHEINLGYAEALTAADWHILFKHGMKEMCQQHNRAVTFMAKPFHDWTGSGGHLHVSVWDSAGNHNLFHDADPQADAKQMSELMRHFLGGVLQYTRDFSLFFAPTINSYKRFASESWAPVNTLWSYDNRTSGYRIVGETNSLRIENRIPGADINPYLAYAAMIGAGLYGIENRIEPQAELKGNAYAFKDAPSIPYSMYEALACWQNSDVVKHVFGDQVKDHYANMAQLEQRAFDSVVTVWERERYFEQG